MPDEHVASSVPEHRRVGVHRTITRYRGRCSCGKSTNLHYSTPEAARNALRRTHLMSITANER